MENTTVELAALIARAWLDDEFKKRLEEDTEGVFEEWGLSYDPSEPITVPPRPEGLDMSNISTIDPTDSKSTCSNSVLRFNKRQDIRVVEKGRGGSTTVKLLIREDQDEYVEVTFGKGFEFHRN